MTLQALLAWWNIIFVAPFALALIYLLVYAASGLTFGDADADFEADADVDVDADHDFDGAGDADADIDADADGEVHTHGGAHGGIASASIQAAALGWIGLGRVPLSILLMVMLLSWGTAGFVMNRVAEPWFAEAWQVVAASIPVAAFVALGVTRVVVRSIDRWIPLHTTTAGRRHDLLGATGVAIYDVTGQFGMVSIRDTTGDLYHVPCRMEPGAADVAKGERVVLTGYSASSKMFFVREVGSRG